MDCENKNLKTFGLELVRKGRAVSSRDKDIIDKVTSLWISEDEEI
ncbi:hypothetical protein LCGC14_1394160, partial [marine sediment metagenome]